MPAVARFGDRCSGHGCFPPRPNDDGSPDVFVNGLAAHRRGDHWMSHCCGLTCHDSVLAGGSGTVFVNGRPLGRVGDGVACGSVVAQGSGNVFSG